MASMHPLTYTQQLQQEVAAVVDDHERGYDETEERLAAIAAKHNVENAVVSMAYCDITESWRGPGYYPVAIWLTREPLEVLALEAHIESDQGGQSLQLHSVEATLIGMMIPAENTFYANGQKESQLHLWYPDWMFADEERLWHLKKVVGDVLVKAGAQNARDIVDDVIKKGWWKQE